MDSGIRKPAWGPREWEEFEKRFQKFRHRLGISERPGWIITDAVNPEPTTVIDQHEGVLLRTGTPLPGTKDPSPELWDITPRKLERIA